MAENISPDEYNSAAQAFINALNASREALDGTNPVLDANAKAAKEVAEADKRLAEQSKAAYNSLRTFTSTVLEGNGKLSNYGKSMDAFSDVIWKTGKEFGVLGTAAGGLAVAFAKVTKAVFEQTDNLLKANDQISKLGAANAFSTDQIYKMAHNAGLSSKELDKMTKPMQSLSGGLSLLGNTSAEGIKKFGEMINVTKDVRMEFQRLGMNDEERIQAQADYIKYLEKTGGVLVGQAKTSKALQESSLEYTRNLYELSAITGKSLDQAKSEQEVARANMQWKLQENKWGREQAEALKRGGAEGKATYDRIEKEKKAANDLVNKMMAVGGPAAAAGVQMQYLTGAITKHSAQFAIAGVDIQKHIDAAKRGEITGAKAADELTQGLQNTIDNVGQGTIALAENFQKTMQMNLDSMDRHNTALTRGSMVTAEKTAKDAIAANTAGKGAAAEDEAQKTRNALTEAERSAKLVVDDLVKALSPFVNKWTIGAFAITSLVTSLFLANKALTTFKKTLEGFKGGGGPGMPDLPDGPDKKKTKKKSKEKAKKTDKIKAKAKTPKKAPITKGVMSKVGSFGSKALSAAGRFLGPAGALYGAADMGYQAGTMLNEKFKWSDQLVDWMMSSKDKESESMIKGKVDPAVLKEQQEKKAEQNKKELTAIEKETEKRTGSVVIIDQFSESLRKADIVLQRFTKTIAAAAGPGAGAAPSAGAGAAPSAGAGAAGAPAAAPGAMVKSSASLLSEAGLKLKKGDVQKEGAELDPRLIEIAKKVQENVPGFIQFTGFNDQFHNEKSPKSMHTKGKAFDFVVNKKPTKEEGAKVVDMLRSFGIDHAIDEYNNPSGHATAGHFHGQLKAKYGGMFEGPDSGYPVTLHGNETVVPTPNLAELVKSLGSVKKTELSAVNNTNLFGGTEVGTAASDSSGILISVLSEKLDKVISELSHNNSTQDKILTYSRS